MGDIGLEKTRFRPRKRGVATSCDAKCDAISPDRVEVLARAVCLVAGLNVPEQEREAILARVMGSLFGGRR